MTRSRLVAAFAAVGALSAGATTAIAADDAKIKRGMEVYTEQKCSVCHSIEGKGNKKGALDEVGSKLSEAEIREWITHPKEMTEKTKATRKPPMKAYPNLPAADLDALVAYMGSLKKK